MALLPNGSSPISSAPTVQQRQKWHPALTIGRTRASLIGPKIAICRLGNGCEPCKVIGHLERCNGSSPCTQRRAIVSLLHLVAEAHTQFSTIASNSSQPGKMPPVSPV